jgi:adenylate cyclase
LPYYFTPRRLDQSVCYNGRDHSQKVKARAIGSVRRFLLLQHEACELTLSPHREPDVEVSPNTVVNPSYSRGPALAWDTPDFGDHRKELSCLESSGQVPSISRQQPNDFTPPPYGRNNRPTHLSSNLFNNSFYNSSSDDLPQMSPGFVPQNINNLSLEWHGEDRRPSVASTTTMSSTGSSKRSITGKFHKKLQGFFGDDFDPNAPPPKDQPDQPDKRGRNPSNATQVTQTTRPGSPSASRPRTPNTSSEVTPWDFEPAPANVCFVLVAMS